MIKVGIIGAAGYTGGEAIRLLLRHPRAEITFAQSNSQAGKPISKVHRDLLGETEILFTKDWHEDINVLFLCVGHGEAARFMKENRLPETVKVIDLSQDHRLNQWTYGLPEWNKEQIRQATRLANPGCFATAIQLALLPLAAQQLLTDEVHVSATTGSTGAGQKLTDTLHFSWRSHNLSVYKAFQHQHLGEIYQTLRALQPSFEHQINFIPYRGNFTRGILAAVYTTCPLDLEQARQLYTEYYRQAPFVFLSEENPDVKQVLNTNKCVLHLEKHGNKLLIISAIDNLTKGASGQAVQNMNLMFGLEETVGLLTKPIAF
ncbi:MAG: N-acetyl-gamma-glutamyl-phosphate reductase [Cytophagales bacterium]|nr:N-acetyl-gamma-glutamyl-phosphate reductase [Bernardetiaceae bacterium]MDW8210781.1 N-acetyl-gamma-glutamyl-phosphate reductase [Cytophagales bacterium]